MTTRAARLRVAVVAAATIPLGCSEQTKSGAVGSRLPVAVDASKVGHYPARTKSGGGFFHDDVLEYRVWVHSTHGGDEYRAFPTIESAEQFASTTRGAERPLVLILQREHVDEPEPGKYVHVKEDRITEWQVEWLADTKRGPTSIPEFLQSKAK